MSLHLKEFSNIFLLIIFSETYDAFKVIRAFEDNYLYIILNVKQKKLKTASSQIALNTLMPMNEVQNTESELKKCISLQNM